MRPRLEVVVFTFDHEAFIERALQSVLEQKTDFDYSIRIHDDASSDTTVAVAEHVLAESGVDWRIERAPENRYAKGIGYFHEFIAASEAEFVAFLDGDDYWLDDHKLQTQVDLLDQHVAAALCHHRVMELNDGVLSEANWPPTVYREEVLPGETLSRENFISASSVVLRMSMFPRTMPPGFGRLRVGDYAMWALATDGHEIVFVDRVMSAYRIHATNIWALLSPDDRFQREIEVRIYIAANIVASKPWRTALIERVGAHVVGAAGERAERAAAEAAAQGAAAAGAREELQQLLSSSSWRVTRPMRAFKKFLDDLSFGRG